MKLLRELRDIFPRKQRLLFVLLFFLQWIGTAFDFFGVSLILPFLNVLLNPEASHNAAWYRWLAGLLHAETDGAVLLALTFTIMAVYIIKNLYRLLMLQLSVRFVAANRVRMGARMLRCYMDKPYTFHLQHNTAEILRSITGDVGGAFAVVSTLMGLLSSALIVAALVVFLLVLDVWMTLAVSAALLVCSALYFFLVRGRIRSAGRESRSYTAKMYQSIQQAMGGIKEVKLMGRERFFVAEYERAGAQSVELGRRYSIMAALPNMLIETLCVCSVLGVVACRIASGADLAVVVPTLSAFALAAVRLLPRVSSINSAINTIAFQRPALDALHRDLQESEREERERAAQGTQTPDPVQPVGDIVLTDVSYTYPDRGETVLQHVNLRIRHGQTVGIVGVTGAGKTTLVDVMLGLLRPDSGTVCCGAQDICENSAAWQRRIGYIPQSIYLTDDTIRNNVALGLAPEEIDEAAVWRALERAQLADFVRGLRDGLDTRIGERGVRLSGGQRQRVGIARALYRDPALVFFDEATSSLDSETETAVMQAVHALGAEKTIIIVAHRLTTLRDCDVIYRVTGGGVEEETAWKKN